MFSYFLDVLVLGDGEREGHEALVGAGDVAATEAASGVVETPTEDASKDVVGRGGEVPEHVAGEGGAGGTEEERERWNG